MPSPLLAVLLVAAPGLADLEGVVVDQKGQPVAGAKVVRADEKSRDEATTDAAGRFKVKSSASGFLFVEKGAFRFHGQRLGKPGELRVTLTRRDEASAKKMTALPPALPAAKRKELAARALEPTLKLLEKAKDDERLRPLEKLAGLDPGRALEELEKRPFKESWYDGYVRRAAAKALRDNPEEARTVIDSIKDATFRSQCYLDLHDALPAGKKAERLDCLNQALVASRSIGGNDHRVIPLGWTARRLHALGEKERATKLLREGQAIAKELPTAGWAGYARAAFAEELALIDLPAALELMKGLKDPFEQIRHHGNLAQSLAASNPAEAERVLALATKPGDHQRQYQWDQYAVRVCHGLAAPDLPRARKLAAAIKEDGFRARALAVMADALAKDRPKEALALLDESFALLAKQAAAGVPFNNFWDAAALAGLSLPVAERIDPALVPEFFWRALSFHPPRPERVNDPRAMTHVGAVGALALTLARYDRELAKALLTGAGATSADNPYMARILTRAAALADPAAAMAMLDKLAKGKDGDNARSAVVEALLADGEALSRLIHKDLAQWHVGDEDL